MLSRKSLQLAKNYPLNGRNHTRNDQYRIVNHVRATYWRPNTRQNTVSKEASARLEAKLNLVLTQIATLSSQFDHKISALRQEVSERYQNITVELTADVENREKHSGAK